MAEEVFSNFTGVSNIFNDVKEAMSFGEYGLYISLAIYTILIAIYAVFIWKFYKFLARRDIVRMNLRQYNRSEHPVLSKVFASLLFLVEYIIILPLIVFVWFGILSVFLLILSENQSVSQILLVSAAIVAATRLTAYISMDLSKDLAKIFPFTVLAIFLLNPKFLSVPILIERFSTIPSLLNHILVYLIFIIALEIIIRVFWTILQIFITQDKPVMLNE